MSPSIRSGFLPDSEVVAALDGVEATVDAESAVSSTEAGHGPIEVVSVCAAGSCAGRAAALPKLRLMDSGCNLLLQETRKLIFAIC